MALLEFVLDVAITVRLRVGPGPLAFGAGGAVALLGATFSYFRFVRIGPTWRQLRLEKRASDF